MKKEQKRIQTFLFIVGVLLILITYFYYPYKNKSLVEKNIQENVPPVSGDLTDNATSFESLEYKGLYGDLDKTFVLKSEKAHIKENEPDIVYMNNVNCILYLKDREVQILSDKAVYNKSNYDIFFYENIKSTDGETKIFSENLDLLGDKSIVKIYNNVVVNYSTGSFLEADTVDYNFETKYFKVSMFDDKQIKMKVLNE